jgi:hypothetical protein
MSPAAELYYRIRCWILDVCYEHAEAKYKWSGLGGSGSSCRSCNREAHAAAKKAVEHEASSREGLVKELKELRGQ